MKNLSKEYQRSSKKTMASFLSSNKNAIITTIIGEMRQVIITITVVMALLEMMTLEVKCFLKTV